jgi:cytochrome c peroxidase
MIESIPMASRVQIGTAAILAAAAVTLAAACERSTASSAPPARSPAETARLAAELRAVGEKIFLDASLSASGQIACATCHRPDHAFGPGDGRAVQFGGPTLSAPGTRAVPSLRYLQTVPAFSRHSFETPDDDEAAVDNGPTGGLTWDGRVDRARDQARIPILSPLEMANSSLEAFGEKILAARYAPTVRQLMADTHEGAAAVALEALEAYEQTPAVFAPYSSRFDEVLKGQETLTPLETRGLVLFTNRDLGNCASCHPSQPDRHGAPPPFSDYGLVALGLPRNLEIPANKDPHYDDLGLCGPTRTDVATEADYCGRFRTPTLRNVATRRVFFHNGVVHTLREAVAFYASRDADPAHWFPKGADGLPQAFNDLPAIYRRNIETGAPFGLVHGHARLTDADVDAIVAFLKTLTDSDAWNVDPSPGR